MTDPFSAPAPIATEYPKAALFKGRLVLIRPTKFEANVPNQLDPDKPQDRMTVDITSLDGDVEGYSGREFKGVWINWGRVIDQVLGQDVRSVTPGTVRLGRLNLYKPDQRPGKGNPWGLIAPTEADKQVARDYLANRTVAAASSPAAAPFVPDAAPSDNPFG